jgi:anti-anti-sigma factor
MGYRLDGDTLRIDGELSDIFDVNFDLKAAELLHGDASTVIVDLRAVPRMVSHYLGTLAGLAQQASAHGKKLRVVAAGGVAEMLQMAGFDRLMELQVSAAGQN